MLLRRYASLFPADRAIRMEIIGMIRDSYTQSLALSDQASQTENIQERLGMITFITHADVRFHALEDVVNYIRMPNASQDDLQRVHNYINQDPSLDHWQRDHLHNRMLSPRVQVKTTKRIKGVDWKKQGITPVQQQRIRQQNQTFASPITGELMTRPVRVPREKEQYRPTTTYDLADLERWVSTVVKKGGIPNSPATSRQYKLEKDQEGRQVLYVDPDQKMVQEMNQALTRTLMARQDHRRSTSRSQGGGLQVKPPPEQKKQQQSNIRTTQKDQSSEVSDQTQSKTPQRKGNKKSNKGE